MRLDEILKTKGYDTDKRDRHKEYLDKYEELFAPLQDKEINFLEIGVLAGESMKLWSDYFSKGNIYGIDIFNRTDLQNVKDNLSKFSNVVSVEKVDSCGYVGDSVEERDKYLDTIDDGFFDIIVDDGLHKSQHQIATYYNFISKLKPNGMYIIEDIKNWDNHLHNLEEFFGDKIEITKYPKKTYEDNIIGVIRGTD